MVHVIKGSSTAALYASSYRGLRSRDAPRGCRGRVRLPAVIRAAGHERARVALRITGIAAALTAVGAVVGRAARAPADPRSCSGTKYVRRRRRRCACSRSRPSSPRPRRSSLRSTRSGARPASRWCGASLLVANVGLNLVLIPHAGAAGAAWATLICQVAAGVWLVHDTHAAGRAAARRPRLVAGLTGAARRRDLAAIRTAGTASSAHVQRMQYQARRVGESGDREHPFERDACPLGRVGIDDDLIHDLALREMIEHPRAGGARRSGTSSSTGRSAGRA